MKEPVIGNFYTIRAYANWQTYCEHPSGSMHPDIKDYKSATLDTKVRATNISDARKKARQQIEAFKAGLPKPYDTGNSGSTEPEIKGVTFGKTHSL